MKKLLLGKCEDELKILDDNSIDAIVTDPPYHLTSIVKRFGKENSAPAKYGTDGVFTRASKGFMGKEWDGGNIAFNKEMWKECLRVLKPGGHLLAFGGTRTYHRMTVAIEDAGFEIRDMIEWVYGSGFPKSLNIGKAVASYQEYGKSNTRSLRKIEQEKGDGEYQLKGKNNGILGETKIWDRKHFTPDNEWEGWGTALKPAHEPICMARKPLAEKNVAENVLKYGTGGINIDESRVAIPEDDKANYDFNNNGLSRMSRPEGEKLGQFDGGWKIDKTKRENSQGRFPSNLIHDNSEEVRECFPDESKRFFKSIIYTAKASKSEKNDGCEGLETSEKFTAGNYSQSPTCKDCNLTLNGTNDHSKCSGEVYYKEMESKNTKNNHPTVKPVHLMAWLVQLVSKKGDIVLDPFMGSGTTGVACMQLDRNFIGIEMEEEYIKIAESRIENEGSKPIQMNLFDEIIEPEKKKIKTEKIGLFEE